MLKPLPRYWYMVLASIFEAAATDTLLLLRNSNMRHCVPRFRSHKAQSAAPPAIVPNKKGLISITFLTVCDAMYGPIVLLESTEMMTPPLNLKANVVVPFANCTFWWESVPYPTPKFSLLKSAGSGVGAKAKRWTLRPRMSLAFVASSSFGRAPASNMRSMARAAMFLVVELAAGLISALRVGARFEAAAVAAGLISALRVGA